MGEPGGLLSVGSHRVRHDRSDLAAAVVAARELSWNFLKILSFSIKCRSARGSPRVFREFTYDSIPFCLFSYLIYFVDI